MISSRRSSLVLKILGRKTRSGCGVNRRDFITIGSLGMGGLALPDLLRADAADGTQRRHKAVIMIYLTGGPPHLDMVDLKPNAPAEIRGEFLPISTKVPGIQICELMPRMAAMQDKFINIRTLVGSDGGHTSYQCVTGQHRSGRPQSGHPEIGSILSKIKGSVVRGVPANHDLSMKMAHEPYNLPGPGFLGQSHAPFKPTGPTQSDMIVPDVLVDRFDDRRQLLVGLDRVKRKMDQQGFPDQADAFTQQALEVLTSNKLSEALDLSKEDPKIRERYGKDVTDILPYSHLGYQAINSKFLLARRLVEAGARCVTVSWADMDWHGGNFTNAKRVLPKLDEGLSALVTDLHERGLQDDVTVIAWGEFGRTPRINDGGGRDHWTQNACAIMAGGGMKTGQQIGTTDRYAEAPTDRPVHFNEVFSTLYRNLEIRPDQITVTDLSGRPRYLLDDYRPIPEVI
jgi:hypothetical protein